jgi:hypothetical protein
MYKKILNRRSRRRTAIRYRIVKFLLHIFKHLVIAT